MKLYLIRHGETQENAEGIIQGWYDSELNQKGIRQAKEVANNFKEPVDAIYSSDLLRAKQTAFEYRVKHPSVPYYEDRRLRERGFGEAEGSRQDMHDQEVLWSSENEVSIPGSEKFDDFNGRVVEFLESVKKKFPSSASLVIFAHGGTINRILNIKKIGSGFDTVKNCEVIFVEHA